MESLTSAQRDIVLKLSNESQLQIDICESIISTTEGNKEEIWEKIQNFLKTHTTYQDIMKLVQYINHAVNIRLKERINILFLMNNIQNNYKKSFSFYEKLNEESGYCIGIYIKFDNPINYIGKILFDDDLDALQNYLLTESHKNEQAEVYFEYKDCYLKNLECAALFGAHKCFKYILMNEGKIQNCDSRYAVAGGNMEIIHIFEQHGYNFRCAIHDAIKYHRFDIFEWIELHYSTDPISLYLCLCFFNQTIFCYLIERGADVNQIDILGVPIIYNTVIRNELPCLESLINKNTSLEIKAKNNQTLCHTAAMKGYYSILDLLIQKGDKFDAIEKEYRQTPLHFATESCDCKVCELLIKSGAKIDSLDIEKQTPLHKASQKAMTSVISLLIDSGANINAKDKCNLTPLHIACREGLIENAKLLISKGADINAKDKNDRTPLFYSVQANNLELVKLLIEKGADINAKSKSLTSLLHYASQYKSLPIINYFISKGLHINAQDICLKTPLHIAAKKGLIDVVQLLLNNGATIDATDAAGVTPLCFAIQNNDVALTNLFIERGANIDAISSAGKTPLHYAACGGNVEIFNILIEKNAKVDIKDKNGKTAHEIAATKSQFALYLDKISKK